MARYRKVYIKIWQDKDFQGYTRDGKLVFVYLITNAYIGESGLYEITPKTISQDTGVDIKKVEALLSGGLKNVYRNAKTSTVFVAKYRVYNPGGRPDFIAQAIRNERAMTPSPLWEVFDQHYEVTDKSIIYKGVLNGSQTLPEGINTLTPTTTPTTGSLFKTELELWNEFGPGPRHVKLTAPAENLFKRLYADGDATGLVWTRTLFEEGVKNYAAALKSGQYSYHFPSLLTLLQRTLNQRSSPGLFQFLGQNGFVLKGGGGDEGRGQSTRQADGHTRHGRKL